MYKYINILLVIMLMNPVLHVSAGGGGGAGRIVYDPTNHVENIAQVAKSVQILSKQAQEYALQIKQYETQLTQMKKLGDGTITPNLHQLNIDRSRYENLQGELESLYGNLNNTQEMYDRRIIESQRSGLGWDAYVAREQEYINRKHKQKASEVNGTNGQRMPSEAM